MTNEEWNKSDDAITMLQALKLNSADNFMKISHELHAYYVECCREHLYLWPEPDFSAALSFTTNYSLENYTDKIREHDYRVEGSIFGLQYNPDTKESQGIINRVSELVYLSKEESFEYAVNFGYFVDWVLLYIESWNGRIPIKYAKYLNSEILKRHIEQPFNV